MIRNSHVLLELLPGSRANALPLLAYSMSLRVIPDPLKPVPPRDRVSVPDHARVTLTALKSAVAVVPVRLVVRLVSFVIVSALPVERLGTDTQLPAPMPMLLHCYTYPI